MEELDVIRARLETILSAHIPPLRAARKGEAGFEVCGSRTVMQGKQMVEGHYFASVVPKPKDVRLYFFPIYTHADSFSEIPEALRKCLKGKSCFHIKKLDENLISAVEEMVEKGIHLYQQDGLL
ncbi:MAG: hypothetical protein R3B47_06245 [Bacteroidia bacterium]